jgi:hypothetical protein
MVTTLLNSLRLAGNEARHLGSFQAVMHVVDVRRRRGDVGALGGEADSMNHAFAPFVF